MQFIAAEHRYDPAKPTWHAGTQARKRQPPGMMDCFVEGMRRLMRAVYVVDRIEKNAPCMCGNAGDQHRPLNKAILDRCTRSHNKER